MIRIRKSDGTRLRIRKNGVSYIARLFNSIYKEIVSTFKQRVLADVGTFESETYLENKLGMFTQTLFSNASYIISPNGYKTSKIYALKPENGNGDLNIIRNTTATRINEYGVREIVPANRVRIDYSNGKPCFLIEPQRTNLVYPSATATTQVRAVTAVEHTLSFYGTGTVTLSGAFSGSLVGTGANNRVSLTFTPTAGNLTLTVSGTVTDWQLEARSNATSLIPTVTGSVTRNADYPYKNNIIDLIGQTEGSIYVEFDRTTETYGLKHLLTIYGDGGVLENSLFLNTPNNYNTRIRCQLRVNSVAYDVTSIAVKEGLNKVMLTYTNSEFTLFLNGFKVKTKAIPSFPSLYNLNLLQYDNSRQYGRGYLVSLWKTKLSDADATKLTSL